MGLKKGHTNNPNGRPKGTPNRTTRELRVWVQSVLSKNTNIFESDLKKLLPEQRLAILEKMLKYCMPTHQVINIKEQVQEEYAALEKLLKTAPDTAVRKIADRVVELAKAKEAAEQENPDV